MDAKLQNIYKHKYIIVLIYTYIQYLVSAVPCRQSNGALDGVAGRVR